MDWNRDGKVDAHDATLYHIVINNDSKSESIGSGSGGRYTKSNKSRANHTPAAGTDSGAGGWVMAAVVIVL